MLRTIAISIMLCGWISATSAAQIQARCQAPELFGYKEYDDLVCGGISMMNAHRYERAAELFERAMVIPLFEYPNFMLYPRLAQAYFLAGNLPRATEMLEKGRLSLLVYTRMLRCVANNTEFVIVWQHEPTNTVPFSSPFQQEIANVMCGEAHDHIYYPLSFDNVAHEAVLVRNYTEIANQIARGR